MSTEHGLESHSQRWQESIGFIYLFIYLLYFSQLFTFTSRQVTFIYIALLTMQIVSKQLHDIKIGK